MVAVEKDTPGKRVCDANVRGGMVLRCWSYVFFKLKCFGEVPYIHFYS